MNFLACPIRLGVVAAIGVCGVNSYLRVAEGHVAIVFNTITGMIKDKVYSEGTYLIIPWIEKPCIYDTRPQTHLFHCNVPKSMVTVVLRVVSHIVPDNIFLVHRSYFSENYYKKFMRDLIDSSLISYSSSWLSSHKEEVSKEIHDFLIKVFKNHIVIDDVIIDSVRI